MNIKDEIEREMEESEQDDMYLELAHRACLILLVLLVMVYGMYFLASEIFEALR